MSIHLSNYTFNQDLPSLTEKTSPRTWITLTAAAALTIIGTLIIQPPLSNVSRSPSFFVAATVASIVSLVIAFKFFSYPRNTNPYTQDAAAKSLSEETIKELLLESQLFSFYPPKRPPQNSPPDKDRCIEWINSHPAHLKSLATKFIHSLKHVSQAHFEAALKSSADDFNIYISSQHKHRQNYTILLPECCPRPYKTYHEMSNLWVTLLALPYLKYPPKKIIVVDNNKGMGRLTKWANEEINNALLFDDALYSGRQITELIDSLSLAKTIKLHVIAPFMTTLALKRLQLSFKDLENPIWIAKHQEIPIFFDSLTAEEKERVTTEILPSHPRPQTLAAIYFDHKIPDSWSILFGEAMKKGTLLHGKKGAAFIPKIVTPYKNREASNLTNS